MDRDMAVALLDQLHAAQKEFYSGGDALPRDPLASDIASTLPGNNDACDECRQAGYVPHPGRDR